MHYLRLNPRPLTDNERLIVALLRKLPTLTLASVEWKGPCSNSDGSVETDWTFEDEDGNREVFSVTMPKYDRIGHVDIDGCLINRYVGRKAMPCMWNDIRLCEHCRHIPGVSQP